MIDKELIEDCIYNDPIALLTVKDQESIDFINSFLPYSTGFEIECNNLSDFTQNIFKSIPNIIEVICDYSEKRFRISNGLQGLICLYNICQELPKNCSLNYGSGIHYHIDCTDVFNNINNQNWIDLNNDWIIERLKLWETAKDYNSTYCMVSQNRAWVRLASEHQTIEVRIGEMTFDYNLIVKRIIDCNKIVKRIKDNNYTIAKKVEYQFVDIKQILNYLKIANTSQSLKNFELLKQELENKRKELEIKPIINPDIDMKKVIGSRIKKFV